jgi:hypothetical protein
MQQIADWLEKLGMSEYAPRFAENDIDFLLLPELTDQDLEKIGVASLGHRRKILKAIVALNGGQTAEAPAAPEPTPSVPPPPPAVVRPAANEPAGERRYVTVMFCDLVGSTSISAQLDLGTSRYALRVRPRIEGQKSVLDRQACPNSDRDIRS